jgi:hypothetical protein
MTKFIALLLLFVGSVFGQTASNGVTYTVPSVVTVTVTVDGTPTVVTLTEAARIALARTVAEETAVTYDETTNAVTNTVKKFNNITELLVLHVLNTLLIPKITQYKTSVVVTNTNTQVAAAMATARAAIVAAAQGQVQ